MVAFIISVAVFTISVGLYLGMIVTVNMEGIKRKAVTILVAIFIGLLISGALALETKQDEEMWNNGHCSCGEAWSLKAVTSTKSSGKTYYWECTNCKAIIKTTQQMR